MILRDKNRFVNASTQSDICLVSTELNGSLLWSTVGNKTLKKQIFVTMPWHEDKVSAQSMTLTPAQSIAKITVARKGTIILDKKCLHNMQSQTLYNHSVVSGTTTSQEMTKLNKNSIQLPVL